MVGRKEEAYYFIDCVREACLIIYLCRNPRKMGEGALQLSGGGGAFQIGDIFSLRCLLYIQVKMLN